MHYRNLSALVTLALFMGGCGSFEPGDAQLQERVPGTSASDWSHAQITSQVLAEPVAIRINARTNMITYFEGGQPKSKWKVATGREGYGTPKGVFRIHHKDVCPPWSRGGVSAGPCAPDNPLGKKALWFNEGFTYGMHGVDAGHLWTVTASNPRDRDQSSGCVRNHPENIEWLFARVSIGTPVVVGLWDEDPSVIDCSGKASLCDGRSTGTERLPSRFPSWCGLSLSDHDGLANVRMDPRTNAEIVNQLSQGARVRITERVIGESVAGDAAWFAVSYTLSGREQHGFLHSSLIDCTR